MRVFITIIFYSCLLTAVICRPAKNEQIDSNTQENEYEEQYADPDDGSSSEIVDVSPGQNGNLKHIDETKPAIDREISEDAFESELLKRSKLKHKDTVKEENNRNPNEQKLTNNNDINKKEKADDTLQSNNIKNIQTDITADSDDNYETANKRSKKEVRKDNSGFHPNQANINNDIKNDEEIIKRQIKKLTKDELDELLNSLSTDKRELLLKIIDSSIDDENVEKREIDKKHVIIDDNAEDSKQLTKGLDGQKIYVSLNKDNTNRQTYLDNDLSIQNTSESTRADTGKIEKSNNEMKRGANKENVSYQDNPTSEDKEYDDQEDPCAFLDQIKNERKRDVSYETDHLTDSLKSLEDSFSHANDYNDVADFSPHVRVKRKNSDMTLKKKAAYLIDPIQSCVPLEHAIHSHDEEGKEYGDVVSYDSSAYINKNLGNEKDDHSIANDG